jgi:Family of unknown function (DUF6069)
MTVPISPDNQPSHPRVDPTQLWPGGIATAVVAGLVALVGVLACRWLLNVPILAPKQDGAYGDAHTTGVVFAAAAAALAATGLLHLLLISTPRPLTFFGWIVSLATVVAVLFPFSTAAPVSQKIATGAVSLVIGIAIGTLLNGVGGRSVRVQPRTGAGSRPARSARYPAERPANSREWPYAGSDEDATRPYPQQNRDEAR